MQRKVALKPNQTAPAPSKPLLRAPSSKLNNIARPTSAHALEPLKPTPKVLDKLPLRDEQCEQDEMIEELKQQIRAYEQRISEYDQQCITLRQTQQAMSESIIMSDPQILEKDRVIQRLRTELDAAKADLSQQVTECRQMVLEIKQSQFNRERISQVDNEYNNTLLIYTQQQELLTEQESQIESLKQHLQLSIENYQKLVTENRPVLDQRDKLDRLILNQKSENEELLKQNNNLQLEYEKLEEIQQELEQQLHEIKTTPEYKTKLNLQNQITDYEFETRAQINELNELDEEINAQEAQNRDLMQQMIAYGRAEGYEYDRIDQTFDEYLDGLAQFIKAKNRPKTSPLKRPVWEDTEQDPMFEVKRVNGEYEIQLLVDPSNLDVPQLLELFTQIDQLSDQLRNQRMYQVSFDDEDSDIMYGSEHDTIDDRNDDDYYW
ncbi:Conserved_hypothetical protein [Hexamita inflata]|uniref:Uncharacterized protein n=1 Tax=Hexamita inflata TaxID=28002 RepID=A0AA86NUE5_9EUKA|nr:Conserved hypothetical protein [Hexamita inflata]